MRVHAIPRRRDRRSPTKSGAVPLSADREEAEDIRPTALDMLWVHSGEVANAPDPTGGDVDVQLFDGQGARLASLLTAALSECATES